MANIRRFHKFYFKIELCSQIVTGKISKSEACGEHKLSPTLLDRWVNRYKVFRDDVFVEDAEYQKTQEAYVNQLDQALGQAHSEAISMNPKIRNCLKIGVVLLCAILVGIWIYKPSIKGIDLKNRSLIVSDIYLGMFHRSSSNGYCWLDDNRVLYDRYDNPDGSQQFYQFDVASQTESKVPNLTYLKKTIGNLTAIGFVPSPNGQWIVVQNYDGPQVLARSDGSLIRPLPKIGQNEQFEAIWERDSSSFLFKKCTAGEIVEATRYYIDGRVPPKTLLTYAALPQSLYSNPNSMLGLKYVSEFGVANGLKRFTGLEYPNEYTDGVFERNNGVIISTVTIAEPNKVVVVNAKTVFPPNHTYMNAILSPDGKKIAWARLSKGESYLTTVLGRFMPWTAQDKHSSMELWITDIDGNHSQYVGYTDGAGASDLRWLPSGKNLSWNIGYKLYRIPVN